MGEGRETKYIKGLLRVKPSTRGFIFIISFYSNSKLMREVLFFTSVLQKRNGGTESLSNFPKGAQQSQVSLALTFLSFHISHGIHNMEILRELGMLLASPYGGSAQLSPIHPSHLISTPAFPRHSAPLLWAPRCPIPLTKSAFLYLNVLVPLIPTPSLHSHRSSQLDCCSSLLHLNKIPVK